MSSAIKEPEMEGKFGVISHRGEVNGAILRDVPPGSSERGAVS